MGGTFYPGSMAVAGGGEGLGLKRKEDGWDILSQVNGCSWVVGEGLGNKKRE